MSLHNLEFVGVQCATLDLEVLFICFIENKKPLIFIFKVDFGKCNHTRYRIVGDIFTAGVELFQEVSFAREKLAYILNILTVEALFHEILILTLT